MNSDYHIENAYFFHPLDYDEIYLLQIGRLYCKSMAVVDAHIHYNLFELTVVTDGKGIISTNGVPTHVKNGDIYFSVSGDIHSIESDKDEPLKYDYMAFRIKDNKFKKELDRIAEAYYSPDMRLFNDDQIRRLVADAIAEHKSPDIHSEELLNAIFREILILLIRNFRTDKVEKAADKVNDAEILCCKLMNYIDTHIYTMESLSELCDATDYSYGYLSALFKKTTAETLSSYYNKRKSDAARLLLKENRLTVTEISETLGYSSLYAFSKAFKKQFGVSPRNYRKQFDIQ